MKCSKPWRSKNSGNRFFFFFSSFFCCFCFSHNQSKAKDPVSIPAPTRLSVDVMVDLNDGKEEQQSHIHVAQPAPTVHPHLLVHPHQMMSREQIAQQWQFHQKMVQQAEREIQQAKVLQEQIEQRPLPLVSQQNAPKVGFCCVD